MRIHADTTRLIYVVFLSIHVHVYISTFIYQNKSSSCVPDFGWRNYSRESMTVPKHSLSPLPQLALFLPRRPKQDQSCENRRSLLFTTHRHTQTYIHTSTLTHSWEMRWTDLVFVVLWETSKFFVSLGPFGSELVEQGSSQTCKPSGCLKN